MTSRRTRDRLVQRLIDNGIRNEAVLEQIRNVPRHLFVDEALAMRMKVFRDQHATYAPWEAGLTWLALLSAVGVFASIGFPTLLPTFFMRERR